MFNTPGETVDDVKKTLDLAKEIDADGYNYSLTTPFPGTDLYSEVKPKLSTDEYSLLLDATRTLTDPRFKLAQHDMNLDHLAKGANLSFNTLCKRVSFVFDKRYIRQILKSRRKNEYVLVVLSLIELFMRRAWESFKFKVPHLKGSGMHSLGFWL